MKLDESSRARARENANARLKHAAEYFCLRITINSNRHANIRTIYENLCKRDRVGGGGGENASARCNAAQSARINTNSHKDTSAKKIKSIKKIHITTSANRIATDKRRKTSKINERRAPLSSSHHFS